MLPDIHMHTSFSADSETPVETMVETAIRLGMDTVCITDHHDPDFPHPEFQMTDPAAYFAKLQQVRETYRDQIRVLAGVEIGMQPHLRDQIREFAEAYPFDFVIGSQHLVAGHDPYERGSWPGSDEELYQAYFEETLANVRTLEGFQALGHLDYVVRYGMEQEKAYSYRKFADVIDEILKTLIARGIALEVNTGGFKSGIGFPNPHPDVLRRYREMGGELVTLGADAHVLSYIGYEFDRAAALIKSAGFSHITVYIDKKAEFIAL